MKTLTALLLVAFVAFVTGCGGGESTDDAASADTDAGDMDMMDEDTSGMSDDMTMDEDMSEMDDAMQMDGDMDSDAENGDTVDAQTIMDSLDTTQEDDSDADMDMDSDASGDDMSDTEEEDK
ncbi:MAG: hypothetical protein OXO49_00090 [Gammaproteobacteria bacterium]|nr:hypothetical protein [Gammaproteobacteria bacterium]MDE0253114.1 hypothetical protein [Gammaproteobacteria bacterium]MDE0402938.1 hypothetical protein [Gammaproteobacteria bacterium]